MKNRVNNANQVVKITILNPALHGNRQYWFNIHRIMQIAISIQEKKPANNQDWGKFSNFHNSNLFHYASFHFISFPGLPWNVPQSIRGTENRKSPG
jgi:hypothetical protein